MTHVKLKGVKKVTVRLANGTSATYWYAWVGGPRLVGEPGSPEFIASYNRAVESLKDKASGTVLGLSGLFRTSAEFKKLSARMRADYLFYLKLIEDEFGDMPLDALSDRRARAEFYRWRDTFADTPRKADYAFGTLRRLFSWAKKRGEIDSNPCEGAEPLYEPDRVDKLWTPEQFDALFGVCSDEIRWVVRLAVLTAQRQGDLLGLAWTRIQNGEIRMRQSKRRRRVVIELYPELQALLDEIPKRATTILTNERFHQPWTTDGFKTSFRKACRTAGVTGVTFHDLRGTAITGFAMRGMTALEIASLAGMSEKDVSTLLDKHYLGNRAELARLAVRRCLGNKIASDSGKWLENTPVKFRSEAM